MGGNGSFFSGITNFEENRRYKTILSIGDNIKILETKNPRLGLKLPEESHTPNRIYAAFYRSGKGLKEIGVYGADGKKLYEIHIIDHHGLGAHYHNWLGGKPVNDDAHVLTNERLNKQNHKFQEMNNTYIINDVNGNPMNAKYPPNKEFYGEKFSGYKSQNEKILFHDFVVMSKDVSFMHNGTRYYFYVHNTTAIAYNVERKEKIAEYPNELELLENFTIDGQPFISLIDEIDDIKTFYNVFKPHLALDDNGYPYNCKYPPNKEKYGDIYEGYKTWTEEVLFHRFGILCYDVCFVYKNNEYHLLKEYNYAAVCDEHYTEEYETFADEMALIENFKINGKPLIELIDDITEIDSV